MGLQQVLPTGDKGAESLIPCSDQLPNTSCPQERPWVRKLSSEGHCWRDTQLRKPPVINTLKRWERGFPGGAVVKNLPARAGDTGSRPGPGRSHMPQSN